MIPKHDESLSQGQPAVSGEIARSALREVSSPRVLISQRDNYAANFGEVLRSSALFWAPNDVHIRTTISISNYWKYKNSNEVCVLANFRDATGKLITRNRIDFSAAEVVNLSPPAGFTGTVEVEAFSTKNLRIPYAAVMAVYECAESITMVHSYTRAYSQHEIEDGRTICVGEEGCWTLRETNAVTSFCVFHNGASRKAEQVARLRIRRSNGDERSIDFPVPSLAPFETVVVEPRKYFPDIVTWLDNRPGNGRLSFRLEGAFTRCLCGVRATDWSQLQVTHTNFDYSTHETDKVEVEKAVAYMLTPSVLDDGLKQEIVVYPDTDAGQYKMTGEDFELGFMPPQIVRKEFDSNKGLRIRFWREDGSLPSRIVTGLRLNRDASTIAAECSLGVAHHKRPPKHFSWMLVSKEFASTLLWVDLSEIYGGCPADAKVVFKFYSPDRLEPFVRETAYAELPAEGVTNLQELFSGEVAWSDSYGYVTVWSTYGGLEFFSTLKKGRSISIEHAF